jgi:transposase-like protein
MAINGSGVRDISRVLHISADVVIETLKKRKLESADKSKLPPKP